MGNNIYRLFQKKKARSIGMINKAKHCLDQDAF